MELSREDGSNVEVERGNSGCACKGAVEEVSGKVGMLEFSPGVVSSGRVLKMFCAIVGIGIGCGGFVGWLVWGRDPGQLVALAGLFLGVALGTQISQNVTGQ